MNLLPKWVLPPTMPSIYDSESFTSLEMVSKLYGAMNALIEEFNKFDKDINSQVENFIKNETEHREVFEYNITTVIKQFICSTEEKFTDLREVAKEEVNKAIQAGDIKIAEVYDPVTESLNMIVGGEI